MSAELVPPSVQRFVKDLVLIARESADEASRRADAMQTVSTFVDDPQSRTDLIETMSDDVPKFQEALGDLMKAHAALPSEGRNFVLDVLLAASQRMLGGPVPVEEAAGAADEETGGAEWVAEAYARVRATHKLLEVREGLKLGDFEESMDLLRQMRVSLRSRNPLLMEFNERLAVVQREFRAKREATSRNVEEAEHEMERQGEEVEQKKEAVKQVFEQRMDLHNQHITLLGETEECTDDLISAQTSMLDQRACGCLLIDKRQLRRWLYIALFIALTLLIVYGVMNTI